MFRRDRVDRAFARYCRSGEPQALAEVFDRTAKELLRVALYLCGNRADAEDLLQRTFLSAIEGRARFDAGQRVLPWLCGIVVNHARSLQRDRARRQREGAGVADAVRDPAEVVADRELQQRLQLLRNELVSPYREVLELHLEHGMNAKQIAERLGRPAGTVRTQLVRALELLRRRLPGGFVAGLVPFVPEAAALAKVKVAVVAAAKGAVPMSVAAASVVTAVAGGVVMANKLLVVVPLVAVVLGVGAYLAMPDAPPAARSGLTAAPLPATAAGELAREQIAAKSEPAAMPANQRQPVAAPAATTGTAVIRGRCIDGEGNPVAGCKASLTGYANGTAEEERYQRWLIDHPGRPWANPDCVVTGADGRYEIHFAPPPMFLFRLTLAHPDYVLLRASWQTIAEHDDITLADGVLLRGTRIRGRVLDEGGRPVPDVIVVMGYLDQHPAPTRDGTLLPNTRLSDRSDDIGGFANSTWLVAGDYTPSVWEHKVASPERVTLHKGQPQQEVQITLDLGIAAGEISGTVIDDAGRVVNGALLYSVPDGAHARTAKDGSFRLVRKSDMAKKPIRIRVEDQRFEPLTSEGVHAWNGEPVRLVVQRGAQLIVQARTSDGAAVDDFGVLLFSHVQGMGRSSDEQPRARGHHDAGVAVVTDLRRGTWLLAIVPGDNAFASTRPLEVEVRGAGPQRVDVVVPRAVSRRLLVEAGTGKPVAGASVRLVDTPLGPATPRSMLLPLERWECTNARDRVVLLQELTTDADGAALLRGPAERLLDLLLPGPGHVPQIVHGVSLEASEPLVVKVSTGATLRATVKPEGMRGQLLRLAHLPADGAVPQAERSYLPGFRFVSQSGVMIPTANEPAIELGADGTFRIDGVPPGPGELQLCYTLAHGQDAWSGKEAVAHLELQDGATCNCEVDLGRFVAGELDATLLHNGQPLGNANIFVTRLGADGRMAGGSAAVSDADGHLRLFGLAGSYSFDWSAAYAPDVRAPEAVALTGGGKTTTNLTFLTGEVQLCVVDTDGHPVLGLRISLRPSNPGAELRLRPTDVAGRVAADVPPGTYKVIATPKRLLDAVAARAFAETHRGDPKAWDAAMVDIGEITVQQGLTTKAELHLPPAWAQ